MLVGRNFRSNFCEILAFVIQMVVGSSGNLKNKKIKQIYGILYFGGLEPPPPTDQLQDVASRLLKT